MTARQAVFVAEYLTDFNARQAALRAGYAPSTREGWRILTRPAVAAAVRAGVRERVERLGIDADHVLLRALKLYDLAMASEPVQKWDNVAKTYVTTGEYKFDGALAAKALELIGKLLGAFRDRAPAEERPFVIHVHTEVEK